MEPDLIGILIFFVLAIFIILKYACIPNLIFILERYDSNDNLNNHHLRLCDDDENPYRNLYHLNKEESLVSDECLPPYTSLTILDSFTNNNNIDNNNTSITTTITTNNNNNLSPLPTSPSPMISINNNEDLSAPPSYEDINL